MMLNFKEFRDCICRHCDLCLPSKIDYVASTFCFEMYKNSPGVFVSCIYPEVKALKDWPLAYETEKKVFQEIFCKSELCGKLNGFTCKNLVDCVNTFGAQTRTYGAVKSTLNDLELVVKIPTPNTIVGGSKSWVTMVKKME